MHDFFFSTALFCSAWHGDGIPSLEPDDESEAQKHLCVCVGVHLASVHIPAAHLIKDTPVLFESTATGVLWIWIAQIMSFY